MRDDTSVNPRERKTNDDPTRIAVKKIILIGAGTALVTILAIESLSPMAKQTNKKISQAQQQASPQQQGEQEQPADNQPAAASGVAAAPAVQP